MEKMEQLHPGQLLTKSPCYAAFYNSWQSLSQEQPVHRVQEWLNESVELWQWWRRPVVMLLVRWWRQS